VSLFIVNYEIELEIKANFKKVEYITEFAERIKKYKRKLG